MAGAVDPVEAAEEVEAAGVVEVVGGLAAEVVAESHILG